MEWQDHMKPVTLALMLLANCIPFWIAASDSSEPSVGSRICLNIVTPLSSHSTEYGFCSWSLASKKRPADPSKKIARAAGLKLCSAFPPPLERFAFLDLASDHARSRLDDGGEGYLRGDKYHTRIVYQDI